MMKMKHGNNENVKWEGFGQCNERCGHCQGWQASPNVTQKTKGLYIRCHWEGFSGLMYCQELSTLLDNKEIDAKVALMEARSRLGTR
jgi:hypothetical protein